MSAPLAYRGERSRSIAQVIVLLSLAACADPTATVPSIERVHVVAAVTPSAPTAVAIGNVTGYGVNDAGTIVGPSSGKTSSAYLWDASLNPTLKLLGSGGLAWSIAGDGHTVGGKNAAGDPVVWTSTSLSGPWPEHVLPNAGFGGAVRAIASDPFGPPIVMTGNVWTNGTVKTPARWTPCTGESGCVDGWLLTTVPLTLPITEAWGQDINPSGMIVGMEGTGCCRAAFWDANNDQSILKPLAAGAAAAAWGLNDAGTIIVGQSNDVAVAWIRASTSVKFDTVTAIPLETTKACKGGGASIAYAVNPDFVTSGTIVGQACGAPVAWKVSLSPVSITKVVLPSTGHSTSGEARSINRSTPAASYRIVGAVNGAGAYWTNF